MGYRLTDTPEEASLLLINTCAIREHAELRALSIIGGYKHIREKRPDTVIGVCGCMAAEAPEFCDGNVIMFYLSPALSLRKFLRLTRVLEKLFVKFPLNKNEGGRYALSGNKTKNEPTVYELKDTEWIDLNESNGKICALSCGLFPPCTPLLQVGETIIEEKLALLKKADNVFGIFENKICVFKEEIKNKE